MPVITWYVATYEEEALKLKRQHMQDLIVKVTEGGETDFI